MRAVNTGVSGFVEATGRIARHSKTFERTTLLGEVRLLSGETPYARMGDVVPWACLGMLGLLGILSTRSARDPSRGTMGS